MMKEVRKMKKIIVLGVICIVILIAFIFLRGTKKQTEKQFQDIPYEKIELNRTKLYLREGFKYMLKLQYNNVDNYDMDNEELYKALEKMILWTSSDNAIAKVDSDGVITAIKPGKANITAKVKDIIYNCEVTILTQDTEMPIDFKNDFFTEETYKQIDKLTIMTASGTRPIEIFDKYSISFIYSMLSEIEIMDVCGTEPENFQDKPIGVGIVVIVLKNNKKLVIGSHKTGSISLEGKYYKYIYGSNSSYGQGTDFFYEINNFTKNM